MGYAKPLHQLGGFGLCLWISDHLSNLDFVIHSPGWEESPCFLRYLAHKCADSGLGKISILAIHAQRRLLGRFALIKEIWNADSIRNFQ